MIKKRIVQSAKEEIEKKGKEAKSAVIKGFTELPRILIEEFFGVDMKPETQKVEHKGFTTIDISSLEQAYKEQDKSALDNVRTHLAEQADMPKIALRKRRFEEFRSEEKKAIQDNKQREIERKKDEEEEKIFMSNELKQQRQAQAIQSEPKGKPQRGGLFAKKVKTVENRPSFGKQ